MGCVSGMLVWVANGTGLEPGAASQPGPVRRPWQAPGAIPTQYGLENVGRCRRSACRGIPQAEGELGLPVLAPEDWGESRHRDLSPSAVARAAEIGEQTALLWLWPFRCPSVPSYHYWPWNVSLPNSREHWRVH